MSRHEFIYITSKEMSNKSEAQTLCKKYFGSYKFGNAIHKLKMDVFRSDEKAHLSSKAKFELLSTRINKYVNKRVRRISRTRMLSPEVIRALTIMVKSQIKISISIEDINWSKQFNSPSVVE